jgi:hypothetical protein
VTRTFFAAATTAALVFAGCGSSATKTVTVATPTGGSSTSTAAAGSTSSAATTNGTDSVSQSITAVQTVHLSSFRSPSGNIGCIIVDGGARCDISKRNWSPPPRPASCSTVVDFGQGLAVNPSGRGRFVCAGDTTRDPQATPLAYGEDSTVGSVTCASRTEGITCTNTNTRHGFFIAVQGYRIF